MRKGVTLGGLKIKDLINEGQPVSLVLDASVTLAWDPERRSLTPMPFSIGSPPKARSHPLSGVWKWRTGSCPRSVACASTPPFAILPSSIWIAAYRNRPRNRFRHAARSRRRSPNVSFYGFTTSPHPPALRSAAACSLATLDEALRVAARACRGRAARIAS